MVNTMLSTVAMSSVPDFTMLNCNPTLVPARRFISPNGPRTPFISGWFVLYVDVFVTTRSYLLRPTLQMSTNLNLGLDTVLLKSLITVASSNLN